jgi:hypothetical protein
MLEVEIVFVNIIQRIKKSALKKRANSLVMKNKQHNIFCLEIVSFSTLFKQNFVHGLELGLVR